MTRDKASDHRKTQPPTKVERGDLALGKPNALKSGADMSAITCAFIENSTLLKKFLTRFLYRRQDIEDVVQEAYLRAYGAEKMSVIDQPKAYLFRVARNLALNELKSRSRRVTDYIEDYDVQDINHLSPTLEEEIQAQEHLGLYCEAIASLPRQCRKVCLLRKAHGLKHKEISEHLGITVSSVEKHLRKGALACEAFLLERENEAGDFYDSNSESPSSALKSRVVAVDSEPHSA